MSPLLTPKQLKDLTGTEAPADQLAWLMENRVPHFKRRDGRPALTWEMVNSAKAVKSDNLPKGFNLSAANG